MMAEKIILWTDEKIAQAFIQVTNEEGEITGAEVMFVIKGIVAEYEARIDELEQRILQYSYDSELDDEDDWDCDEKVSSEDW